MGVKERLEMMLMSGQQIRSVTILDNEHFIHIYFITDGHEELFSLRSRLLHESRTVNLGRGYSSEFHRNNYQQNPDAMRDHIHLYFKNNELCAINRDGSGHDGSRGYILPKYAAQAIQNRYPDFNIPNNRVLESLENVNCQLEENIQYLLDCQDNQLLLG